MEKLRLKIKNEQGQAGLAAILISVIMLVIGLSLASRANREVEISTSESEGTRTLEGAQSAAELGLSGVEGQPIDPGTGDSNLHDTEAVSAIEGDVLEIVLDEGMSVELVDPNSSFTVWWGVPGLTACEQAALLVSNYKGSGGKANGGLIEATADYQAYRPFGASNCSEQMNNGYEDSSDASGVGFHSMVTLDSNGASTMRIKALYAGTIIRIDDSDQIERVRASAINEQDGQARVVEVRQTKPSSPSVMDYALFAGTGAITKCGQGDAAFDCK